MPKPFPPEFRARALRLVKDRVDSQPDLAVSAVIKDIAPKLGVSDKTLDRWWRQEQIDAGVRPGVPSDVLAENKTLKRENQELKRANEILKLASAFFAAELDRPGTKCSRLLMNIAKILGSSGYAGCYANTMMECFLPLVAITLHYHA